MLRDIAILGAALIAFQGAETGAQGAPVTAAKAHGSHHARIAAIHTTVGRRAVRTPRVARATGRSIPAPSAETPISLSYQVPPQSTGSSSGSASETQLTYQEQAVGRTANENGDRDFLMVDKALGKIILFENGNATFSAAALTGESTADRLPPGALTEKFAQLSALATKVTPAGRFTVRRSRDGEY